MEREIVGKKNSDPPQKMMKPNKPTSFRNQPPVKNRQYRNIPR